METVLHTATVWLQTIGNFLQEEAVFIFIGGIVILYFVLLRYFKKKFP